MDLRRRLMANNVGSALDTLLTSGQTFYAPFADKGSGEVSLVASGAGASQSPTFTRATTATTVNSAGLIVSVASGVPRSYYDPTTLAYMGYLAEGLRTNLCLQSNSFTTTWTNSGGLAATQNQTGPDGATSAWTMTGTGAQSQTQSITLTAATYTYSRFVKKTVGATQFPVIRVSASPLTALATIDTNNGVATVWTSQVGGWTIVTSSATCKSFNADYWRVELTFLATAAAWLAEWWPLANVTATQSSGTLGGGTGTSVCYGAQLEAGAFASSYIPTTTASVPRNADVLTYPSAGNIGAVGTLYFEYQVNRAFNTTLTWQGVTAYTDAINFLVVDAIGYSGSPRFYTVNSGVQQTAINATPENVSATNKTAFSFGLNDFKACINAGTVATDISGTVPSFTTIGIGASASSSQPYCAIRNVRIWQVQLSSSQLQAVTA